LPSVVSDVLKLANGFLQKPKSLKYVIYDEEVIYAVALRTASFRGGRSEGRSPQ